MKKALVFLITFISLIYVCTCGYKHKDPESCFETYKDEFNELKNLVLEQEGRFDIQNSKKDGFEVVPRESIQVSLDSERVRELMEKVGLYFVCVRPEEEYFCFKTNVEFLTTLPNASADLCYSSVGVPEYSWPGAKEWTSLGDGWYYWVIEQI